MSSSSRTGSRRLAARRVAPAALAALAATLVSAPSASAFNYVDTQMGESWGVNDGAAPRVDTGSIRSTTASSLQGFGGIRVAVDSKPTPRFNGALMRGFLLRFDPPDRFSSTQSVDLGGVAISRDLWVNRTSNYARFVDTFKNTTDKTITVDVAFGGQTGTGTGANQSKIVDTSSSDTTVDAADSWALVASPTTTAPNPSTNGPSAVVLGTASPFPGGLNRVGNFLRDTFAQPLQTVGHEANYQGYQNTLVLAPGQTRTLAHFVVIGLSETTATPSGAATPAAGSQVAAVKARAIALAAAPAFGDMPKAQICALANWDVQAITFPNFAPADCATAGTPAVPPVAAATPTTTGSTYDVTGKTIDQLHGDMVSGKTTAVEITRAYLDRIAAYDEGPFAFNAFAYVAKDALEQAKAADEARKAGNTSRLLGIPVAVKDLFQTKDMPTTNGSLTFEGFRPKKDATQVALLRKAGAVIIGKAGMEEYATSGSYSDDAHGQVWNAFDPSKSPLASSGGSAVATAADMAAFGMGTQTGDSLYAPAQAASLVTLRGTDGMASLAGVMPLSYLQDYAGAITKSVSDLADVLNATTGTDPDDFLTAEADAKRPTNWRDELKTNALQGKRIGWYSTAFTDPFGTTGTTDAQKAAFAYFEAAGATMVDMSAQTIPSAPANNTYPGGIGNANFTGWQKWIDATPESPYKDPREIILSQKKAPYSRSTSLSSAQVMATDQQIANRIEQRDDYKANIASWMDAAPGGPVDAVVYPGLLSDITLNDGNKGSFGRRDPLSPGAGVPSVSVPIGVNDHGEPTGIQIQGKAWSDGEMVGMAYAFEQVAKGHVTPTTVPALPYKADPTPPVIEEPAPIPPAPTAPAPPAAPAIPAVPSTPAAPTKSSVAKATVQLRSSRKVRVKVTCGGPSTCKTTLRIEYRDRVFGSRTVTLKPGVTTTVIVTLSTSAAKTLSAKRRLRTTLTATVPAGEDTVRRSVAELTLKAVKRR